MKRLAASPRNLTKPRLVVLFVVYLILLGWLVLWKLDVPFVGGVQRVIKLVPFAPSGDEGASAPFEVVANFALFIPFGVYLGLLAPWWAWWKTAGTVAGASLATEVTQYVLGIGSSDITDIIVNTAGGLAGYGLLALAHRRFRESTPAVMTRVCSIGTVLAVLGSAVFIASPLQYAPPRDTPVRSAHSGDFGSASSPGLVPSAVTGRHFSGPA